MYEWQIVIDTATKRIKPSTINQRTTLILRNIPTDAERNAVESLLEGAKVSKILNLRSDVGNNWFATFETEEATKDAMVAYPFAPFHSRILSLQSAALFVFIAEIRLSRRKRKS
jgi:hypothetical protein